MKKVVRTDPGKIRPHNEDYAGVATNRSGTLLAVVCDGMGGHQAGEVASRMAGELILQAWKETEDITASEEAEDWLRTQIHEINEKIFTQSMSQDHLRGMGTTLVAAICTESFATIAYVGDSRCYIVNESGMQQVTDDHSLVNELVKIGQIPKEAAEHHPQKHVLLRAVGTEPDVLIDIITVPFKKNDYLLLCSDGLTNEVPDEEIAEIISTPDNIEEKATKLVERANQNGGEDNITLVLIYHVTEEEAGETSC